MTNALYYGDNLAVLRESIADKSVNLIYLDPPFNSSASYNVLFKAPSGEGSQAQIEAFEDTWHWNESAERAFDEVVTGAHSDASIMLRAMRTALGDNDMMAYLAMMAVRIIELYRVLKVDGNLFLHCDLTAKHYLKIVLDSIFTPVAFRNEITWVRTTAGKPVTRNLPKNADYILWYAKSEDAVYNALSAPLDENDLLQFTKDDADGRGPYTTQPIINPAVRPNLQYTYVDKLGREWPSSAKGWRFNEARMRQLEEDGRLSFGKSIREKYYLNDRLKIGKQLSNIWSDISGNTLSYSKEGLGYPTQKPVELLERILGIGSNANQVVLDPFCGCGTTVHAAQKLNRGWIGIDITHLAVALVERRLKEAFPGISYDVHGVPKDHAGARDLAERDKHQFQMWITAKIGAQPYKGGKKGMDRGIDGYLHFRDVDKKPQFAIISVKGGGIKSGDVRDLKGTMEREKAALGLFLTLNDPTREMEREAASAGLYETGGMKVPRLQILTAAQILDGKKPQVPFGFSEGFKKAAREDAGQDRLL